MIYVTTAGLVTTAGQLADLLTIKEKLCNPVCTNGTNPIVTVTYNVGNSTLNGGTLFVPIIATIQVAYKGNCGQQITQTFMENFKVAFQGQTALPTTLPTVTPSGMEVEWTDVNCCKARSVTIRHSVLIAL